jgi:hypothetical protein
MGMIVVHFGVPYWFPPVHFLFPALLLSDWAPIIKTALACAASEFCLCPFPTALEDARHFCA